MTTSEPLPAQAKTKPKRINYALAATLLASGVTFDEIAQQVGAATGNSLRVGWRVVVARREISGAAELSGTQDFGWRRGLRMARRHELSERLK